MKGLNKIMYIIIGLLTVVILVTFYAKTSLYVTIIFNSNGGSKVEDKKIVRREKIGELPIPTKEGYTFINWVIDDEKVDENYIVKENITLIAIYEKDKEEESVIELDIYTIKYDTDGGTKIGDYTVIKGEKAMKPTDPVKAGYEFKEWTLDGKSYDFNSEVTEDITLKATYIKDEVKIYTVTFDTDGGSSIEKKIVEENTVVAKPVNPKKEGYEFVEWVLDGKTYNFSTKVVTDIVLKAKWNKLKEKTTVIEEEFTEEISYSTKKIDEINMLKGTTSVVQPGVKGEKKVVYKVTYNSKNEEIDRQKLSEETIKEPTEEIVKVGKSDYNINTDKYYSGSSMSFCLEENIEDYSCTKDEIYISFIYINNDSLLFITNSGNNINVTDKVKSIDHYSAIEYNGKKYVQTGGAGTTGTPEKEALTVEVCTKYHLSCGSW